MIQGFYEFFTLVFGQFCDSGIVKDTVVVSTEALAALEGILEFRIFFPHMKDRIDIAVKGTVHTVTDKAGAFQFFDICTYTGKI